MRRAALLALAAAAVLAGGADAARADGWHHGGPRFFLGFNFAAPVYPAYPVYPPPYRTYYYAPPPAVVYAEPPVVVYEPRQIRLGQPVGRGCREYTAPAQVGGRSVLTVGTACPMADGSWRIVN